MKPTPIPRVPWNLTGLEIRALARRPEWWGLISALILLLFASAFWPVPFRQPVQTQFEFLSLTLQTGILWFGLLLVLQPPLYHPPCGAPRARLTLVTVRQIAFIALGSLLLAALAALGWALVWTSNTSPEDPETRSMIQNLPNAMLSLLAYGFGALLVLIAWADFLRRKLPRAPALLLFCLPFFLPAVQPLGAWSGLEIWAAVLPQPNLPSSPAALLEGSATWSFEWPQSLHPLAQALFFIALSALLPDRRATGPSS